MAAQQHIYDTLIVGTGFAGLAMAIKLKEMGRHNVALIERAKEVGGTWRDNEYPGAACDVPSHLYSLSFAPKHNWTRKYPSQPELYSYLKEVAANYELYPHIHFDETLAEARFVPQQQLWRVRTGRNVYWAQHLVMGNGGLAEPKLPNIPGAEMFAGKTFHSAQWDHSYSLKGKRVAVIGTGASAIQIVPELVQEVGELSVFQRTPNWLIPRFNRPYSGLEKQLFKRVPGLRKLHRTSIYWGHEARVMGMVIHPMLMKAFQQIALLHLRRKVKSLALRQQVTPDYLIGCRRILISNDWYPALQQPHCELVTSGITAIDAAGIHTVDGGYKEVDAIVYCTGFYATENPIASRVIGPDGQTLAEAWESGEEAYLGTTVAGFPNLSLIIGPNTGLGHTSMIFMIEAQVNYIAKMLQYAQQAQAHTMEVKASVQAQYNGMLQKRLQHSVWATGCDSWYQHKNGKITALWPGFTFEFWLRTQRFNPADYVAR